MAREFCAQIAGELRVFCPESSQEAFSKVFIGDFEHRKDLLKAIDFD
jgi:hypothetical protein